MNTRLLIMGELTGRREQNKGNKDVEQECSE
jgi:hypothetical protein